jgi:thiol-disulfide isomerase/thioredoxin
MKSFSGKVVLLDFWFAHCGPCAMIHPYLEEVRKEFVNTDFVLVAISIDKSKETWLSSIKNGLRTSSSNVNLYTNGQGDNNDIIKHYNVKNYPTLILIDKSGRLLPTPIDPREDNGQNLKQLIRNHLSN